LNRASILEDARLRSKIDEMRVDSDTLNRLGHALGVCYCTDTGCHTAEPQALLERADALLKMERREWDYHGVCVERDELRSKVDALGPAVRGGK